MPKTLHCFSSKYVVSDRKKEIYEKTHFNYKAHTLKIRIKRIFNSRQTRKNLLFDLDFTIIEENVSETIV